MRHLIRDNRGMSIIEMSLMLAVMFILAGMMSPIVSSSVTTARAVKAQQEAALIASALINFQQDVGTVAAPGRTPGQGRRAEVLISGGDEPSVDTEAQAGPKAEAGMAGLLVGPKGQGSSSRGQQRKWLEAGRELVDDYLVTNRRGYPMRRVGETTGWNGPYLSTQLGGDPWGNQYMVNTAWLDGGLSVTDSEGQRRRAVYVVSAGANSLLETPFEQAITDARLWGDDIVIRIQ